MDTFVENVNLVKENKDYKYLILSGGGIKGFAFCGAFNALEELGILYNIDGSFKLKGVAGVSIGSLFAVLLVVGYVPSEIQRIMLQFNTHKLKDKKHKLSIASINLIRKKGLYRGKYLFKVLGELIMAKRGNPDYTFNQLYKDTDIRLAIPVVDLTNRKYTIIQPLTPYGNLPIRFVVRMSMAFPFMYEPIHFDNKIFIDGGVLNNYPIDIFDDGYSENVYSIGLHIMSYNEVHEQSDDSHLLNYAIALGELYAYNNDGLSLSTHNKLRTITIITNNYPLTQFTMPQEQKYELINLGSNCVHEFFL